MLAIQVFLRHYGLKAALERFSLKATEGPDGLFSLNYTGDSPKGVPEAEECRGLVLRAPSWDVVAYPFYRFYNNGDPAARHPRLAKAVLWEKRDGTLCTMYLDGGEWQVATRGMPTAAGPVHDREMSFADLFWETLEKYDYKYRDMLPRNMCLTFELTAPENRVITPYPERELRLLTARTILNKCGEYEEVGLSVLEEISKVIGVPLPERWTTLNAEADINLLLQNCAQLDEGFVLTDYAQQINGSWVRLKCKNSAYLLAAKLLGEHFDERRALDLILDEKADDLLEAFPEHGALMTRVQNAYKVLLIDLSRHWSLCKKWANDRKQFAAAANQLEFPAPLFSMLDGKCLTFDHFFKAMPNRDKLRTLVMDRCLEEN